MDALPNPKDRGLGRGLDALLGTNDTGLSSGASGAQMLSVSEMQSGEYQPRTNFNNDDLEQLASSIKKHGILQPILVRPLESGGYEIIAGERRWRAAQLAQLHQVPVVVKDMDNSQALEIALVENLQRSDLDPIEEALGYQRLVEEFHHSNETAAKVVGKSRSAVSNAMRLLSLPIDVQNAVRAGFITAGHARAIVSYPDPVEITKQIVSGNLSVRETEEIVQKSQESAPAPKKDMLDESTNLAHIQELEQKIASLTSMRVNLKFHKGRDSGSITLRFSKTKQLEEMLRKLDS